MKVHELIELLQNMPHDREVEVNDNKGGKVYAVDSVTEYCPNKDLWPDDVPSVVIQVNT